MNRLALVLVLLVAAPARADVAPAPERRLFTRFGAGAAFDYESWHPDGGAPGASYTGWGPALDVTVGRRIRPGLVIAGDLQAAAAFNRSQSYLGVSYALSNTLHLANTLSAIADYAPRARPWLHLGGGLGVVAVTDVDTNYGANNTSWGWAVALHAGVERRVSARYAIGLLARLTIYRFGSDTPPPSSTSTGVLPTLLVTLAR